MDLRVSRVNLFILFFLIFSLICATRVPASTNFNVKDENFQNCLEEIAQSKGWASAEEFIDIKCNSEEIRSLAGVEQFVNLETLSVFNNRIQRVDAEMQKLKGLKMLNVARNNMDSLKLTNLLHLESVYAFDNEIEELRLDNLPALEMIKVHNNEATSFDYSKTPKLSKIYIFNNQLEFMDIYSLPALTYVDCRQNPMPDPLYDEMDAMETVTFHHDGNADDW